MPSASTCSASHFDERVERDDVVAVVAERRRHDRKPQLRRLGEEIDVIVAGPATPSGAPFAWKSGISSRSVEGSSTAPDSDVRAGLARLLEHGDRQRLAARCFCNCARRSAADKPAGPPPTIRTSTSRVSHSWHLRHRRRVLSVDPSGPWSSCLRLLQFRDQRGHDLEQSPTMP